MRIAINPPFRLQGGKIYQFICIYIYGKVLISPENTGQDQ